MSQRFWGLDWSRLLPWKWDDFTVEAGTWKDDALPFVREHYARIFGQASPHSNFLPDPMTDAKQRFAAEMDTFLFRVDGRVVGLLMGHPSDWTTYYMRTVCVLPEYRKLRMLTRAMERTYDPLRDVGVERIEGDCSPANIPMMRMLSGQNFLVTSTSVSERWGYLVRLTKFVLVNARTSFARHYVPASIEGGDT